MISRLASKSFLSRRSVKCRGRHVLPFCNHQLHTVSLQLDYYMSTQFAGVACAMTNELYAQHGIDLKFLPTCPVGSELQRVRDNANVNNPGSVTVGSVEQNIFIPTLYNDPKLKVKGVAAMFRQSPLCLASLGLGKTDANGKVIVGAHEDTVALLERILAASDYSVIGSPRATKIRDLINGDVHSIQAYLTTEVPTLERLVTSPDHQISVQSLEGMNGAKLGYSQMLFAPEEDLQCTDKRAVIQSFLDATFKGWDMAIRDIEMGAKSVEEAKVMLGLDDENNDHWDRRSSSALDYTIQSVGLCSDVVKETFQGDRLGVIDRDRWDEATRWLLQGQSKTEVSSSYGLDADVWQPLSKLLAGNELARTTLEDAKKSAEEFQKTHNRNPSLAVITVGELSRYLHADERIQLYSNSDNSWFTKTRVGKANGFDVKEINLDASTTTTDDLLSLIYSLKDYDGLQVMWPLPKHLDSTKIYNAIEVSRDVDGAHFMGQSELAQAESTSLPLPPVTPAAVMLLLDEHGIELKNKSVLVVGRSRIVGSPLAHMLRDADAIVTVAHTGVDAGSLETMVRSADIVVSCAGSPGLLSADWVKTEAIVINVGTTFLEDARDGRLHSDFSGDLSKVACRFSPVPGGVGPLSAACLFQNVVAAAWRRKDVRGDVEETWGVKPGHLHRSFHFENYDSALAFANKVNEMSSVMDHHANMTISHKCVNGVDVDMEFFTFEANNITQKDYDAARAVSAIFKHWEPIRMSDFSYDMDLNSIAHYPADPRGSSRLLKVDENGSVVHHDNFSDSFLSLAKDVHLVFNESRVVNARLSVVGSKGGSELEMMILDMGQGVDDQCNNIELDVMLRKEGVQVGDVFTAEGTKAADFKVVHISGPWIEDENSQGNGTECTVKCLSHENMTLGELLEEIGTVPIPPYLNRDAEPKDSSTYNTVYAAGSGSVAAPTAGLHFTDEILNKHGSENMSFLSLHVGAGTFKPVSSDDARAHQMHAEIFAVNVGELRRIIAAIDSGKRLMVVGTTSTRTLESLYWCGIKNLRSKGDMSVPDMTLGQDEWVNLISSAKSVSASTALKCIIDGKGDEEVIRGSTSLMIVPGSYDFKVVDDLVTNFHAPDSTLMLLVSAFLGSGEKVRSVYEGAQKLGYRFLSYGDACMFTRPRK